MSKHTYSANARHELRSAIKAHCARYGDMVDNITDIVEQTLEDERVWEAVVCVAANEAADDYEMYGNEA